MPFGCFVPGFRGWDCSLTWLIMIILFFLGAIIRKQLEDWFDVEFNLLGATVIGEIAFFIVSWITQSLKWGFIAGLAGVLIGGYVTKFFFSEIGGGGEFD